MFYSGIYSSKKNTQKIKNCLKSWQQKLEGWRKTLRNSVHSYKVRLEGMIMVCQIRGWGQHLQQKNILQERCIGVQFLKAKARWTQGWGLRFGLGFFWEDSSCSRTLFTEVTDPLSEVLTARIFFFSNRYWTSWHSAAADEISLKFYDCDIQISDEFPWPLQMGTWACNVPSHWNLCFNCWFTSYCWEPLVRYW